MTILLTLVYYYLINRLLKHNFLTCAKAEIKDLTVCIVVNGEKFQSHAMTLTLIEQCLMSNCPSYFHILQYVQVSSRLNHYFLSYHAHTRTHTYTHTHAHTHTHTHTHAHTHTSTHTHTDTKRWT